MISIPKQPSHVDNVIDFPGSRAPAADPARAFDTLTVRLVMAQHRAGTLNPAVVEALLLGVGLQGLEP